MRQQLEDRGEPLCPFWKFTAVPLAILLQARAPLCRGTSCPALDAGASRLLDDSLCARGIGNDGFGMSPEALGAVRVA